MTPVHVKNPNRVRAGQLNREKRGQITPSGRQRLREAALRAQPWRSSTGPRTINGKARSAANGAFRQVGPVSMRARQQSLAGVNLLVSKMAELGRTLNSS